MPDPVHHPSEAQRALDAAVLAHQSAPTPDTLLAVLAAQGVVRDEFIAEQAAELAAISGGADVVYCPRHGRVIAEDTGSTAGFTGMPIYWTRLSCGCSDVDASADTLEAVR